MTNLQLQVNEQVLTVEVAKTKQQWKRGLANRSNLPMNHGMLFDLGKPRSICLWMKNTPLDLIAVSFKEDGVIDQVMTLQPDSEESRCFDKKTRFFLEVQRDWRGSAALQEGGLVVGFQQLN